MCIEFETSQLWASSLIRIHDIGKAVLGNGVLWLWHGSYFVMYCMQIAAVHFSEPCCSRWPAYLLQPTAVIASRVEAAVLLFTSQIFQPMSFVGVRLENCTVFADYQ